jgi:hypothetical protein
MGHAFSRTLGVLASAIIFADATAPASAAPEDSVTVVMKLPPSLSGGAPTFAAPPGFGLVTISEKPPKFADSTISDLIMLATPWPIDEAAPQVEARAPVVITQPGPKRKPNSKLIVQKRPETLTWLKADWWRGLAWLRIH